MQLSTHYKFSPEQIDNMPFSLLQAYLRAIHNKPLEFSDEAEYMRWLSTRRSN